MNQFVFAVKKMKPRWSYPDSAAVILEARDKGDIFRRGPTGVYTGNLASSCLVLKGLTDRPITIVELEQYAKEFTFVTQFRHSKPGVRHTPFEERNALSDELMLRCEHPPYLLNDDWDKKANERRLMLQHIYDTLHRITQGV